MVTLSVTRSRIAAVVARLRRRGQQRRTSPVDSFDAILAAAIETGGVITVPGIATWLGATPPTPDDSVDSYDAYLEHLSQEAAS